MNPPEAGISPLAKEGFHLMAKPAGPSCNLHCTYCFYLEKQVFLRDKASSRMSDEVLEAYTRQYIQSQPGSLVTFEWQGGEPSLVGIEFFRRALELQKKYGLEKEIANSLQTNGTLLDDDWCEFLARNHFLVGLSLDGPEPVHDAYRVNREGKGTSDTVLKSLQRMQQQGVQVNVLVAVNNMNSTQPLEVYRFLRQHGVQFIQFIPIVERQADPEAKALGIRLALPPALNRADLSTAVTSWSVEPKQYGEFLIRIFDEWVSNDVGKVFVMNFEWTLAAWARVRPAVCYLAPRCGRNLIMESNGDIFSCDHFMYPAYRLGNILQDRLPDLVDSTQQLAFGTSKEAALPRDCRECDFLFVCRGGCPKHRFRKTPDGEPGLNYLCAGFKDFLQHGEPGMKRLVELIRRGIPAQKIMEAATIVPFRPPFAAWRRSAR
jgi:uncharacterized protein